MSWLNRAEEKLLAECLARLEAGEALEEILERYPRQAPLLRGRLEAAGWLLERRPALELSPEFLAASRRRLTRDLRQRTSPRQKAGRWLTVRVGRAGRLLQPVMLVLLLILFLNIPVQLFQAASNTLPGDRLYSLKRFQEGLRLATTVDPFAEAVLQVRYTQQRAIELQELLLIGRYEDVELALEFFQGQFQSTQAAIAAVGQDDPLLAESMQRILKESIREQDVVFSFLIPIAPNGLGLGVEQALLLASR
jgi:hypothetical protein